MTSTGNIEPCDVTPEVIIDSSATSLCIHVSMAGTQQVEPVSAGNGMMMLNSLVRPLLQLPSMLLKLVVRLVIPGFSSALVGITAGVLQHLTRSDANPMTLVPVMLAPSKLAITGVSSGTVGMVVTAPEHSPRADLLPWLPLVSYFAADLMWTPPTTLSWGTAPWPSAAWGCG